MKTWGFLIAALGLLTYSLIILVLIPQQQIKQMSSKRTELTTSESLGRRRYVSEGCVYCHSQQPRDPGLSLADGAWGWGSPPKASDYEGDDPHLLGTMRTGPDLFNIGQRQSSRDWHLLHLYQPRLVSPTSIMPAFPYLFTETSQARTGDVVVQIPATENSPARQIVAHPEAVQLVDYLLSLKPQKETP